MEEPIITNENLINSQAVYVKDYSEGTGKQSNENGSPS